MKLNPFNMIEIMVSLAILVVVVVGIMSLLPKTMKTNQDAINKAESITAAENLAAVLSNRVSEDLWFIGAIPDEKSVIDPMAASFSSFHEEENMRIEFMSFNESGDVWNPNTFTSGIYKVTNRTGNLNDFSCFIKVWKEVKIDDFPAIVTTTNLSGALMIVPTNKTAGATLIRLSNGTDITRDYLKEHPDYTYSGYATYIRFFANSDVILIQDGEAVNYGRGDMEFRGFFKVTINKGDSKDNGVSLGKWKVDIKEGLSFSDGYNDKIKGFMVTFNMSVEYPTSVPADKRNITTTVIKRFIEKR